MRAKTLPLTVDASTGPPLEVASTLPLTVPTLTSDVAPATVTDPFTEPAPIFTPRGTRTRNSTLTSLSRRFRPELRCRYPSASQYDSSLHSAQMTTSCSPGPYFFTSIRTSAGSPRRHVLIAVTSTRLLVDGSTRISPLRFRT